MRLTVLGCRAGMPADGQPSSGYLADTGATRLLLDCGPGIATALSAHRAGPPDAVLISHLHLDHCHDLLPLGKSWLSRLAHYPGTIRADPAPVERPPVPLYVPAGARPTLADWARLFPVGTMPLLDRVFDAAFEVREYRPDDTAEIGDARVEFVELRHAKRNCGMRVTSPAGSLAYTGDTGSTDALARLAEGVDLLVAEASLEHTDTGPHGHLCAVDAARVAARSRVRELLLTHFPSADPGWLAARRAEAMAEFPGLVHLARPGLALPVGARGARSLPAVIPGG